MEFNKVTIIGQEMTPESLRAEFDHIRFKLTAFFQTNFMEENGIRPGMDCMDAWEEYSKDIKIQPVLLLNEPLDEDPNVQKLAFIIHVINIKSGSILHLEHYAALVRGDRQSILQDVESFFESISEPGWLEYLISNISPHTSDVRSLQSALQSMWIATLARDYNKMMDRIPDPGDAYLGLYPIEYTTVDGIRVPSTLHIGWFYEDGRSDFGSMMDMPSYTYTLDTEKIDNKKSILGQAIDLIRPL